MSARIGIFDSGVGGLSVLAACLGRLPALRYFYLGDNLRAPYGSRPPEEIAAFTEEALVRFRRLGVSAAILACNTATAVCLEEMRQKFSFPILGTEPAVLPAARERGKILLLCTPCTAGSERLRALLSRCPEAEITVHACPDLAAAIEKKLGRGGELVLREHLPSGEFDGVVLGCTHYALIGKEISDFYSAPVYDGAEGIARRLERVLSDAAVDGRWKGRGDRNKSLPEIWKRRGAPKVIFLGKSAKYNRKIFKQTFISANFRGS